MISRTFGSLAGSAFVEAGRLRGSPDRERTSVAISAVTMARFRATAVRQFEMARACAESTGFSDLNRVTVVGVILHPKLGVARPGDRDAPRDFAIVEDAAYAEKPRFSRQGLSPKG
jgi:hypothetical protein